MPTIKVFVHVYANFSVDVSNSSMIPGGMARAGQIWRSWSQNYAMNAPRFCDRCNFEYFFSYTCSVSIEARALLLSETRVATLLNHGLQQHIQQITTRPSYGALCPRCSRFTRSSIQNAFPAGIRSHIQKSFRSSESMSLVALLLVMLMTAFGGYILLNRNRLAQQYDEVLVNVLGFAWTIGGLIAIVAYLMRRFSGTLRPIPAAKVAGLDDSQLERLFHKDYFCAGECFDPLEWKFNSTSGPLWPKELHSVIYRSRKR